MVLSAAAYCTGCNNISFLNFGSLSAEVIGWFVSSVF